MEKVFVLFVYDGDTFTVLNAQNEKITIRINEIDAPEVANRKYKKKLQAHGNKSKIFLKNLIEKNVVEINALGEDIYGRTLADVFIDSKNVAEILLENGQAWVYKKYSVNRTYFKLETLAKENNLGLWAIKNPVEPWVFRNQ